MFTEALCTNARTAAEVAGITRDRLEAVIRCKAMQPDHDTRRRVARQFTETDVLRLAAIAVLGRMGVRLTEAGRVTAAIQLPVRPGTALAVTPSGRDVCAEIVPAGALPLLARKGAIVAIDLESLAARVRGALEARAAQAGAGA